MGMTILGHRFVDRGMDIIRDWDVAFFTADSAWHDLDISGLVPAGTVAAVVRGSGAILVADRYMFIRRKGQTGLWNTFCVSPPTLNLAQVVMGIVAVNPERMWQYRIVGAFDCLDVGILSYWI